MRTLDHLPPDGVHDADANLAALPQSASIGPLDLRSAEFLAEARRQSQIVAQASDEGEIQDFLERVAECPT